MIANQIAAANNIPADNPQVVARARQLSSEFAVERTDLFKKDTLRTLVFVLLGSGVIFLFLRGRLRAPWLLAALALLVTIDLWGVDRRYFNDDILVEAEVSADRIPTYDFDSYLLDQQSTLGMGQFRVLSLDEGHPNVTARPAFHYQTLGGYHGAKLRVYQDYLDQILFDNRTGMPTPVGLNLMNVRYVVSSRPVPGYREVYTSEQTGLRVYENPTIAPRGYLVGLITFFESGADVFDRIISDPTFDPLTQAFVVGDDITTVAPIDSSSTYDVTLTSYDAHHIQFQVDTDAERLLVISEVYYPAGWEATIDGESVPILQTNYVQRGVMVPAGQHEVTLRFEPASARLERILSWIGTLLTYGGILGIWGVSMLRKPADEPEQAQHDPE